MIRISVKTLFLIFICAIFFTMLYSPVTSHGYDFEIMIDVSPKVLNIQSEGEVVTVHTDISYSEVNFSTVYLNNVPISSWKADNRGFFVAKFLMESIKNLPLLIDEYNTLQLVGISVDGLMFSGSEEVRVVNNIPSANH